MTYYDILRLGLILAIQSEIDGMKAENDQRKLIGDSLAYTERDFINKADQIRNVVYCNDEQL